MPISSPLAGLCRVARSNIVIKGQLHLTTGIALLECHWPLRHNTFYSALVFPMEMFFPACCFDIGSHRSWEYLLKLKSSKYNFFFQLPYWNGMKWQINKICNMPPINSCPNSSKVSCWKHYAPLTCILFITSIYFIHIPIFLTV